MDIFRRPLLPCILCYVLGLWLVHEIAHVWPMAAVALGGIILGVGGFLAWRWRSRTPALMVLLVVAGGLVMGVREREEGRAQEVVAALSSGLPRIITGTVRESFGAQMEDHVQVEISDIWITSGTAEVFLPGRMRVYAETGFFSGGNVPAPGERVSFLGSVERPRALANFFGFNRGEALRHRQVYSVGQPLAVGEVAVVNSDFGGVRGRVHRSLMGFREDVSERLSDNMTGREARLMRAMLFNDMRSLLPAEKAVFRESGTLHLFAVSGLHVAILGGMINLLFRAMRFGLRGSWIATAVVMLLYLWMVDFVPSATRAYFMLVAITLGEVVRREVDALSSLMLSVAIIVMIDPAAVWDAGFLLSVAGVVGIVMITPLLRLWFGPDYEVPNWWQRLVGYVADTVYVGIAVTVALLPLQILYFGFWNAMSVPANLALASLSTFVLSAGVLAAALSFVWEGGAVFCGETASAAMSLLYVIADMAAEAGWAIFYFRRVPVWLFFGSLTVLLGGYHFMFRSSPEFALKSRARFVCHCVCGLGLLVSFQIYDEIGPRRLEIWSFDVGQGDSTLVRLADGTTILVDGGRSFPVDMGGMVVVPQLRGLGIDRLDFVVATHDDDDHTGGIAEVIRSVGADVLILPEGFVGKSRSSVAMIEEAGRHGCRIQYMAAGEMAVAGGCRLSILNPPAGHEIAEDNEASIALGIEYGDFKGLLMGDAGLMTEARLVNQWRNGVGGGFEDVTFLKLGHHGSRTSTGEEFLGAVRPLVALASCGFENQFGHPAAEVVERLNREGTELFQTGRDGAVLVSSDGERVWVETARGGGRHDRAGGE